MTSQPVPRSRTGGAGQLQRRSGALPAAGDGGGAHAPLHDAGRLGFVDLPGREYWWDRLGAGVRDRMVARVGPVVEWWAYCHSTGSDRPYAVVFGERGLAVCTPTLNGRGRPAQLLTVVPFAPGSVRHASVVQKPRRVRGGRPPLPGPDTPRTDGGDPALPARLSGFLGNLPAEAQSRLQWPFVNGDAFERGDFFYSGHDDELDVWCYLAGRHRVTFAAGHGAGLSGPAHRASWRLVCRQAEVAPR